MGVGYPGSARAAASNLRPAARSNLDEDTLLAACRAAAVARPCAARPWRARVEGAVATAGGSGQRRGAARAVAAERIPLRLRGRSLGGRAGRREPGSRLGR